MNSNNEQDRDDYKKMALSAPPGANLLFIAARTSLRILQRRHCAKRRVAVRSCLWLKRLRARSAADGQAGGRWTTMKGEDREKAVKQNEAALTERPRCLF